MEHRAPGRRGGDAAQECEQLAARCRWPAASAGSRRPITLAKAESRLRDALGAGGVPVALAEAISLGCVCVVSQAPGFDWALKYPLVSATDSDEPSEWGAALRSSLDLSQALGTPALADAQRDQARVHLAARIGVEQYVRLYRGGPKVRQAPLRCRASPRKQSSDAYCSVRPYVPERGVGGTNRRGCCEGCEYPGFGGVPVYELAKGLVASGHRVSVVTTAGSPEAAEARFKGPQIDVHCLPRRAAGPAIRDLYRRERSAMSAALRDFHPDIVHAHWTYEFELAAQDSGLPHVTTAHDAPFTILRHMRDPYRAARLGVALRARPGIRHLSTVSPYMADRWRRQMRYRDPISVIPNSIPQSAVSPSRRPSPHPTVLEVADSGRLKNIGGLLRAFAIVRMQVPEAELRLVGPGLGALEPLALRASTGGWPLGFPSSDRWVARSWPRSIHAHGCSHTRH